MRITAVTPGSRAARAGITAGDELLAVGGHPVADPVDLAFALGWIDDVDATFEFARGRERLRLTLPTRSPEDLGFEVAEPPVRTCGNRCVFCFVDQLPRGLRKSLYVKDEDFRLSFSHGNYITLTNLSDEDYERIGRQRLSPLYVSVHATDDAVRRRMLGAEGAPSILESLGRLIGAGIAVHAQIVVCPGLNDGDVLAATLKDLFELGPEVLSVAVVPVGLTRHREELPSLAPVTSEDAGAILDLVERWQKRSTDSGRGRTFYAADELYLRSGRPLPPLEDYEDLPQIENGVGLLRSFEADLARGASELGDSLGRPLALALVTGSSAAGFISDAAERALGRVDGLEVRVLPVENSLFGTSVTVAGLLPGGDMARAVADAEAGSAAHAGRADAYLLPAVAFNDDGLTIDGMTRGDVAAAAGGARVVVTSDIVEAVLDLEGAGADRDGNGGLE